MKYIEDVTLNLKNDFINYYEWKENDKIIKCNNIEIYKLNNKSYYEILSNNFTIYDENMYNKVIAFCNDFDLICISFDKEGKSKERSKIPILEEKKLLKIALKLKCTKISYAITSGIEYSFHTRKEKDTIAFINEFIKLNKNNKEIIDYLNYEWFNKKITSSNKLTKSIGLASSDQINKLYETIKLINV